MIIRKQHVTTEFCLEANLKRLVNYLNSKDNANINPDNERHLIVLDLLKLGYIEGAVKFTPKYFRGII